MNLELLQDLARHQAWADEQHWTMLRANPAAFEDSQIRKRLMKAVYLSALARV